MKHFSELKYMNTYLINKVYFYNTKALMAPISVSPEDIWWPLYQNTRSSLTGRHTSMTQEVYNTWRKLCFITIHLKFSCSAGAGPISFAQFCSRLPVLQMLINHSEVKQQCCLQRILFCEKTTYFPCMSVKKNDVCSHKNAFMTSSTSSG